MFSQCSAILLQDVLIVCNQSAPKVVQSLWYPVFFMDDPPPRGERKKKRIGKKKKKKITAIQKSILQLKLPVCKDLPFFIVSFS